MFLFDSHSRNEIGQPVPNGFSMLIRFKNKRDFMILFKRDIMSTYKNDINVQYELQYVKIIKGLEDVDFST